MLGDVEAVTKCVQNEAVFGSFVLSCLIMSKAREFKFK
jgi:hypothetical protein